MASVSVLILLVVPCLWLAVSTIAGVDDVLSTMRNVRKTNDSSDCTHKGTKCSSDCSQLIDCINVGTHFYPVSQDCNAGEKCDPYSSQCSSSATKCPKFECGGKGVFPDILDCSKFHICDSEGNDVETSCEDNYAYDPEQQGCVAVGGNSALCSGTPVPECTSNKQSGSLQSNPSIYYTCGNGQPKLFYCEDNTQFNPETLECADASLACVEGHKNYTDPDNCHKYYECERAGTFSVHKSCESNTHFNTVKLACEAGICTSNNTSLRN